MEFTGCININTRRIHDWKVRATGKEVDEVIDNLGHWFRWGSIIAIDTFDGINNIRAGILHDI